MMPPSSAYPQPMAWAVSFAPPERDIEREILSEKKLSDTAKRLREAFARYACFANSIPTFRSREFVKIVKEAVKKASVGYEDEVVEMRANARRKIEEMETEATSCESSSSLTSI